MNYTILEGTVLSKRYLRLTPAIHRGDMVTGWLKRGLLEINLRLEALEEGAPGQVIRLKNPNNRKTLRGIVRDEQSIILLKNSCDFIIHLPGFGMQSDPDTSSILE